MLYGVLFISNDFNQMFLSLAIGISEVQVHFMEFIHPSTHSVTVIY